MFDRKKFFTGFKANFDHTLDQGQVDGIEFLLSQFESDLLWTTDPRNIAYALATIYHETAGSMQPVEEGYYLGKGAKAFQKKLRYYPYFGRGYVQLTWKSNYQKAGQALGIDLVQRPELALQKENAFQILTLGMFRGWFSKGNTLGKYIHGTTCDYKGARRIINGTDKAALIAGYAKQFEQLLKDSAAAPPPAHSGDQTRDNNNPPQPPIEPSSGAAADKSLLEQADALGDKIQGVNSTVEKFTFPSLPTGLGTRIITLSMKAWATVLMLWGLAYEHRDYIYIAVILGLGGAWVWNESRKRNNPPGAGVVVTDKRWWQIWR